MCWGRVFLKRAPAGARLPLRPNQLAARCVYVFRAAGGGSILGVSAHPTRSPPCNFHPRTPLLFNTAQPSSLISLNETHTHTKCTCCKHQNLPAAKTRFLMRGAARPAFWAFEPPVRERWCVCCFEIFIRYEAARTMTLCVHAAPLHGRFSDGWKLCANLENSSLLLAQRTAVLSVESCWTRLLIKLCRRFAKKFSLLVRVSTLLCALYIWLFCEHKHIALNSKKHIEF